MGWSSGLEIAAKVIHVVRQEVSDESARVNIYKVLLQALEQADWDTVDEALKIDPAFDRVVREAYPDWDIE